MARTVTLPNAEILTGTRTVSASENGKTFFLNSATEFVTTLPSPAIGLKFRFIVKAAPSGASYTIVTASSANIFAGSIASSDLDAAGDAGFDDDGDTITFVDSKAVAGDWVEVESDGTVWYVSGQSKVFDGVTVTKVS